MGSSMSDPNRISVGKALASLNDPNECLYFTERVVKLERTLVGKADQYNVPPVVPIGGVVNFYTLSATAPTPNDWFQVCNGAAISASDSPMFGQNTPTVSGTGYVGYIRIR